MLEVEEELQQRMEEVEEEHGYWIGSHWTWNEGQQAWP
jgi:hypothetical protein